MFRVYCEALDSGLGYQSRIAISAASCVLNLETMSCPPAGQGQPRKTLRIPEVCLWVVRVSVQWHRGVRSCGETYSDTVRREQLRLGAIVQSDDSLRELIGVWEGVSREVRQAILAIARHKREQTIQMNSSIITVSQLTSDRTVLGQLFATNSLSSSMEIFEGHRSQ